MSFCSQEALTLTAAIERDLTEGIELKRTSAKYRNPRNAPDELESVAIQYFDDALASGQEFPSFFVQRASPSEFRYYQPLIVNDMCLQCHGSVDEISPAVVQALHAAYPNDMATGYATGDLRGVIRVTVPAAMLEGT